MEAKMDQERQALDGLVASLNEHFAAVEAALARIIELTDTVDEDSSAEIATIAGQVQESTEKIKAALPAPEPAE